LRQRKGDATKNDGFYDLGNSAAQPEAATGGDHDRNEGFQAKQ
jgi:hypothetical protein